MELCNHQILIDGRKLHLCFEILTKRLGSIAPGVAHLNVNQFIYFLPCCQLRSIEYSLALLSKKSIAD